MMWERIVSEWQGEYSHGVEGKAWEWERERVSVVNFEAIGLWHFYSILW